MRYTYENDLGAVKNISVTTHYACIVMPGRVSNLLSF